MACGVANDVKKSLKSIAKDAGLADDVLACTECLVGVIYWAHGGSLDFSRILIRISLPAGNKSRTVDDQWNCLRKLFKTPNAIFGRTTIGRMRRNGRQASIIGSYRSFSVIK